MNKDKHMKKVQEFTNKGEAYIHCEVKDFSCKIAVGGDVFAIMYACYRVIKRSSEVSNSSFEENIKMLEELYIDEKENELKEV